jgi:hypothetical protein
MKSPKRKRRSTSKRNRRRFARRWFGLRQTTLERLEDRLALATLSVSIVDDAIVENGGGTIATVARDGNLAGALEVSLSSNDTTEATVPPSVTILDGEANSPPFPITGVDDQLLDGTQTVTITADAMGASTIVSYRNGTAGTADDNGPQPVGVWVDGVAVKDYAGTHDRTLAGWFNNGGADSPPDDAAIYWTQSWNPQGQTAELVIKFDEIFVDLGADPTQAQIDNAVTNGEIPLGSTINDAQVRFRNWNLNEGAGNVGIIQRLLQPWIEDTVGWNFFGTNGLTENDGVATAWEDGVGQTTVDGDGPNDVMFADVTASMNLMALGAANNNGWGFIPTGGGFCGQTSTCTRLFSSEHGEAIRPALIVDFTAPSAITSGTDTLDVLDDDVPALSVVIADDEISENGGTTTATVTRTGDTTGDLTISLNSSDTTEAVVPVTGQHLLVDINTNNFSLFSGDSDVFTNNGVTEDLTGAQIRNGLASNIFHDAWFEEYSADPFATPLVGSVSPHVNIESVDNGFVTYEHNRVARGGNGVEMRLYAPDERIVQGSRNDGGAPGAAGALNNGVIGPVLGNPEGLTDGSGVITGAAARGINAFTNGLDTADPNASEGRLLGDYMYLFNGANSSQDVDIKISGLAGGSGLNEAGGGADAYVGLAPNSGYRLYIWGQVGVGNNQDSEFSMFADPFAGAGARSAWEATEDGKPAIFTFNTGPVVSDDLWLGWRIPAGQTFAALNGFAFVQTNNAVTIPDGQATSSPFTITGVDDAIADGTQTVTITASAAGYNDGTDTVDVLDDEAPVGKIAGTVLDEGTNTGQEGATVYVDLNRNGQLDAGEPQQQSAVDGTFTINNVPVGDHLVGQIPPANFEQASPDPAGGNSLFSERVAAGLDNPVFVTHAPSDEDRLFIVEQGGAIQILDLSAGALNAQPFLTIADTDASANESGLLGMAFHPDYANNGRFYVNVTVDNGGVLNFSTHVREYTVSGDPNVADPGSAREIISFVQPFSNHNGGWLGFSPNDGLLYVASGDGGSGGDPQNHAQTITNDLLGKMLRLDVDGDDFPGDANLNYAIPPTNPFVNQAGDDEIWAYGLRNPWRNSFDRQTGDLWIGDVGQGAREEIDFQPAGSAGGENYAWNRREGTIAHNGGALLPGDTEPVYDYAHGGGDFQGNSVVGGHVYRGPITQLQGLYIFADTISSNIWSFDPTDPTGSVSRINANLPPDAGDVSFPVTFGEDAIGNLYVADFSGGEVFRISLDIPAAQAVTVADGQCVEDVDFGNQAIANSSISDFVWEDENGNGVQDNGEPGLVDVTVNLLNANTLAQIATTDTIAGGIYAFNDLLPGDYIVEFEPPNDFVFTKRDQGNDDTVDSDADRVTGRTGTIALGANETNNTVDAGLFRPVEVTGDIFDDLDGDGINEAGEDGVNEPVIVRALAGQIDDFEDGTTFGWRSGAPNPPNPNPPENVATGGPNGAGDSFLHVTSTGGGGAGSRLVAFNTAQWTENLGGFESIRADLNNLGATPLEVRIVIDGAGGRFASTNPISLTAGGGWDTHVFSLVPGDLTAIGGTDVGATLAAVSQLRILHSNAPAFSGNPIVATLGIDNIAGVIDSTTGNFDFVFDPGVVRFEFVLPPLRAFSPKDQGVDDAVDSDVNPDSGFTDAVTFVSGDFDDTIDAGMIRPPGISATSGDTVVFQQGVDVVSSDGLINIPNYDGTQDTYLINAGAFNGGASNFGTSPTLQANQDTRLSVLRFDVSALEGLFTEISSATLRLFSSTPAATGDTEVYRLADENSAWREGVNDGGVCLGCNQHHATWFHLADFGGFPQPTPTWISGTGGPNVSGTDYDAAALGSLANAGAAVDTAFDIPLGGDLTALFTEWASAAPIGNGQSPWTPDWNWMQPAPQTANEGFLLRGTVGGDDGIHDVHSSEAVNEALRPQLVVNYGGDVGQLTTTELGGTATFSLVLDTIPTDDVTIDLSSSDLTEGTVAPASVTFTPGNALTPQLITVTGVDDAALDGDVVYSIITDPAVSNDPNYDGLNIADFSVTNLDDEQVAVPDLTVAIDAGSISENGGSTTATVTRTDTNGDLTVNLLSDDTSEATVVASVVIADGQNDSPAFTITAVDDALLDGTQTVTITASAAGYNDGTDTLDVNDHETLAVAINVAAISENGGSATGTVTRSDSDDLSQPLTVDLLSDDTSEATVLAAVEIPANQAAANFTITAVDDALLDGIQMVTITASAAGYNDGTDTLDVTDHETLALAINPAAISEDGGSATGTVTRSDSDDLSQPLTVDLLSNDTSEATVPAIVEIPANQAAATFTITAVDDALLDGTQTVTITGSALGYNDGTDTLDVTDHETLAVAINAAAISEDGGSTTGTVTRSNTDDLSQPLTVDLLSNDTSEATVPAAVEIPANQAAATFTITAVDDALLDGTQTVTITASHADYAVDGSETLDVTDHETLALAVNPAAISEDGGSATGTVTRSDSDDLSQPLTVDLASDDTSEATVPAAVEIPANQAAATFTITTVDDALLDGTQTVTITASAAGYAVDGSETLDVTDDELVVEPEVKVLSLSGSPIVIDDGDLGYSFVGSWLAFTGAGRQNDLDYNAAGNGNDVATWTFGGLNSGTYRVSATWAQHPNRATNAPYTVLDGAAPLNTVNINQELPPDDFNDLGSAWEDLGLFTITGNTLVVELSDEANEFVIADAIRIEELVCIEDGAGTIDFGTTDVGAPVQRTFTVLNEGIASLTLDEPIGLPPGYSVADSFGSIQLAPGAQTEFTIQLDAAADGTFAGDISFGNNDGDENPFDIPVTGTVDPPPAVTIIDDGDPGFTGNGFAPFSGAGFQNDLRFSAANAGNTASWNFTGLVPGVYNVTATWAQHPNRATNAAYAIDGGAPILVNQELPPNPDALESGVPFQNLLVGHNVNGSNLIVTLNDNGANEFVIADAIRIERVVGPAEIQVLDGATNLIDGGSTVDLGTVPLGAPTVRTFTVANVGGEDLTLGAISVPSGFSAPGGFVSTTLTPGQQTTFQVQANATSLGTFSGAVSFGNNDADEDPFDFAISAIVADVQPEVKVLSLSGSPMVIDDSDLGYSFVGSWLAFTGAGRQNDLDYNAAGNGNDVATWTFGGLNSGTYRVSATWAQHPNRATNAPYTVLDGAAPLNTVNINQELPPDDFNDLGSAWEDLGLFTITGNTLVVELSDEANEFVIADAIRIEELVCIEDGAGTIDFGTTDVGAPVQRTFTVLNEGIASLTLDEPIGLPPGYSVADSFGSIQLAPGAQTEFTIQLDAAADGTFAGDISFGNNDGDENPFDIPVTGTVDPPPAVTIIDDGDPGFTGNGFAPFSGAGFQNDLRFSAANAGNTASWNFTGLVPGVYNVTATWAQHPNRATNAAYAIDGGAPILVNQELPPNPDALESGVPFQNLLVGHNVNGSNLIVTLNDNGANEFVIADAIRIERVGPLGNNFGAEQDAVDQAFAEMGE